MRDTYIPGYGFYSSYPKVEPVKRNHEGRNVNVTVVEDRVEEFTKEDLGFLAFLHIKVEV